QKAAVFIRIDATQSLLSNKVLCFPRRQKPEVIMTELSEPCVATFEQLTADTEARLAKANKRALDFMFGAQRLMLEEIVFSGNEMLERARTEMHLFSELASKMAGSHS